MAVSVAIRGPTVIITIIGQMQWAEDKATNLSGWTAPNSSVSPNSIIKRENPRLARMVKATILERAPSSRIVANQTHINQTKRRVTRVTKYAWAEAHCL